MVTKRINGSLGLSELQKSHGPLWMATPAIGKHEKSESYMMPNNEKNKMAPAKPKDYDNDGVISDREVELEIKLEKAEAQSNIAKIALGAMIALMAFLISPWGPGAAMISALDASLATFFVAMASIVGAYMGFSAWMSRK